MAHINGAPSLCSVGKVSSGTLWDVICAIVTESLPRNEWSKLRLFFILKQWPFIPSDSINNLWEILKDLPRSNSGRIKKKARYLVLKRLSVCACRSGCGSGPWRLREPRLLLALHVRHTDLELCRTHRHGSVGESLTITPVSASSVSQSCWLGAQKRPARL